MGRATGAQAEHLLAAQGGQLLRRRFRLPGPGPDRGRPSRFGYRYSCYQLEYSRNLLFKRGATLDEVFQGLHSPSRRGARRVAGVNLHQPRMRAVAEALLALAPRHDTGFALDQLVDTASLRLPKGAIYTRRQASYDLSKLRAKSLAERIPHTRRYRVTLRGVNTLMAWTVLREKVIKPVLHGAGRKRLGRPPKHIDPIDQHYINLQREMRRTLSDLGLAS